MRLSLSRALCATTALATGLLVSGSALAQSTGTAVLEELVVTGSTGPKNLDGAIVAIEEPKSRAAITAEFISRQAPGQSILDSLNLLPAVNFTNNDAYGSAGGRATTSSFDITPSPVADYLYVMMGEARLMKGLLEARSMWDATISPRMFLSLQPREPMLAIAKAAGEMAPTRAAALTELMKLL